MGTFFDTNRPFRIRPILTLDDRPRTHPPFVVRANRLRANDNSHRITTSTTTTTSTTPSPQTNNTTAPQDGALTTPAAPQFANQVIAGNDTADLANQVDSIAGVNSTTENEVDVDDINSVDDNFISLINPFGSGGECRHNYHCRGRERCVRRNGEYICTRHFCNEDRDCSDGLLCREQRCRRCTRCRDTLQATVPKG